MIPFADVTDAGRECLSVFHNLKLTIIFKDNFDEYDALKKYLAAGMDDEAISLLDKFARQKELVTAISATPEQLTVVKSDPSVHVSGASSYFHLEGVEVGGEFSKYLDKASAKGGDIAYLKRFFERLAQNPNAHSRKQLYRYIENYGINIADDGYMVIYKSVKQSAEGKFIPTQTGYGIVNGVVFESAYLDNSVGNTVEIPRDRTDSNPNAACSTGLHVGNYGYAHTFSDILLAVKVNPRDVVSVPHDAKSQKIRVCKYTVLGVLDNRAKEIPESYKSIVILNDGDETVITSKPVLIKALTSAEAATELTLEDYFTSLVKEPKFKKKGRSEKLFENRAAFLAHFYSNVPLSESDKNKLRKRTAKLFPAEDRINKEHVTNLYNLHYSGDTIEKK